MSDDDLGYITGLTDVKEGLRKIPNKTNCLILVTLGKNGVISYYKGQFTHVPTFNKIRVKETTVCGDAFIAAIIYRLLNSDSFTALSTSKLTDILTFANGVATIVGTRYGASNSMRMAKSTSNLITKNLRHSNGMPVECVIADTTIGGVTEAAKCADKFAREGVGGTITGSDN